jgi:hypothetical protein
VGRGVVAFALAARADASGAGIFAESAQLAWPTPCRRTSARGALSITSRSDGWGDPALGVPPTVACLDEIAATVQARRYCPITAENGRDGPRPCRALSRAVGRYVIGDVLVEEPFRAHW